MTMTDFWPALVLVFASEMGDKSQIVSFGFGTQHKLIVVLPAILLGIAVMLGASTVLGGVIGSLIPYFWMHIVSGILMFVFAYLSIKGHHEGEHAEVGSKFGAFVAVFLTFVVSELGDKTIFATMTLASHSKNWLSIWLGGTTGMFAADVIAIGVASLIGKALPARLLSWLSALVFVVAGAWTIYDALKGQ